MDRERLVRRSAAAFALALLLTGTACSGGGGEAKQAKQEKDKRDHHRSDHKRKGAPGEDVGDAGDKATSTTAGDGASSATTAGQGSGSGDGSGATASSAQTAYAAYQAMFERLAVKPDPGDDHIATLTSGRERNHVVDTLDGFESRGQAVEFGIHHKHNIYGVTVHSDGTATVLDCFVSDERVVDATSRAVVRTDPEGGSANIVTATLVRHRGRWKVDSVSAMPVGANESCGRNGVIRRGT